VCGADMQGTLNGVPICNWSSFIVSRGSTIKFDAAVSGCRTYMAVSGGIDVPVVLESRSTYTQAKVGGFQGRVLWQGDVLNVVTQDTLYAEPRKLEEKYIPRYSEQINLRVILGPQENLFSTETIMKFFSSTYIVGEQADRMGYHLEGPAIMHIKAADIISDAVCLGAIQVPVNGMPIIMTADHQTTGGFAKLGAVIRVDLSILAQAKPGDCIRFTCIAEEEAIEALREERERYGCIEEWCK